MSNVEHPAHYAGQIEAIDYIKDKLTPEAYTGFCIGNVIKYLSRYEKKGKPLEDLQKAEQYLKWAIETVGGYEDGTENDNGNSKTGA